jgi:hypothetical protein
MPWCGQLRQILPTASDNIKTLHSGNRLLTVMATDNMQSSSYRRSSATKTLPRHWRLPFPSVGAWIEAFNRHFSIFVDTDNV